MADAPEIKVRLTAEDQGVSAAIKELGNQLKTLKKTQDETAASGFKLANAFSAIASAAAVLGLARIGREAFDSAVNIGKMADKTGISTQALSVFHHVAAEAGVSTEVVDKSLVRAAKSITEFGQGSKTAALGFQILGITQKNFAGLNSDQKIALVTAKLGGMAAGFQKTTAAQLIFSRSGAEFIPVANAIAGEGFGKISESASKLGLLLTQETTDSFRVAKASMTELEAAGTGIATQFEAGLLPAIGDVADAFVKSIDAGKKTGESYKEMGEVAGSAIKYIADGFIRAGVSIAAIIVSTELIFSEAFTEIKIRGTSVYAALGEAAKGHFSLAKQIFENGSRDIQSAQTQLANQQKAIWDDAAVHIRTSVDALFDPPKKPPIRPDNQTEGPKITPAAAPTDAGARAALAFLAKQLDDEIAIRRAYAKQAEEVDKEMFDRGELTLTEYYQRRRAQVQTEASDEIAILRHGIDEASAAFFTASAAGKTAATDKDKDKQKAAAIQALTKVEELQSKISEAQINSSTKTKQLDDEQFKAKQANQAAVLEFEKLIDTTGNKRLEAAKAEIEIEKQKLSIILEQSGASQAQIDQQLARFEQVKTAEASFEDDQKKGEAALKDLADQKAAVDQKVASGQLFTIQGQEQIRQIEASRLPQLQQIAALMLAHAKATGDEQKISAAEDFQKQVGQLLADLRAAGQQMKELKQGLQDSLTSGFATFFETVGRGTESVARSFENLAGSVISSMAKMSASMLAQMAVQKIFSALKPGGDNPATNVASAAAAGTAQAAPLTAAATALSVAGTEIIVGGTGLTAGATALAAAGPSMLVDSVSLIAAGSSLAAAAAVLQTAATTLLIANTVGSVAGLAEGGLVQGPGGPKADAIPARLSAGEFVVKADAVSAFGPHNLEAINRGLKPPSFQNLSLPKFSEGGLVGSPGAAGASGDIRMAIGLDKGLILQHLSSRDAGRIILDHLSSNPKALNKAIGRSQG